MRLFYEKIELQIDYRIIEDLEQALKGTSSNVENIKKAKAVGQSFCIKLKGKNSKQILNLAGVVMRI